MDDKRRLKRWHLIYYLRVFDQENEALLGHIVDITTEGMRLVSEWPIPLDKAFQLWMEIPRETGESGKVYFQAHSLWTTEDVNPDFHVTGYRLVSPSSRVTLQIRRLIDEFKF